MRAQEPDLSELSYASPNDSDIGSMDLGAGSSSGGGSVEAPPQRQKMSFSREPVDEQKLNRANRRKQKKR
jgi:hypothetical protein